MRRPLRIDPSFRDRILRYDPANAHWLDAVPDVHRALITRLDLVPEGDPRYGGTSIVVPVRTASASPAVLKLVSPVGDAQAERRALTALAGHGVVTLWAAFEQERALLLERLAGPRLSECEDPREAIEIAGAVAREISAVPAPPDAPRLADQATAWLDGFHAQHARARHDGMAVPPACFHAASEAITDLTTDRTSTLTHGDLSLENIMPGPEGTWVAIDPLYLCGPVEHDAHTAVRSVLGPVLRTDDPGATLRDLLSRFCRATRADEARAAALSHARMVASYYWEAQHGGDPVDVENLRRAIDLRV